MTVNSVLQAHFQFLVSRWDKQFLVEMTHVALEDLFRSFLQKSTVLNGGTVKRLQTKMPTFDCVCSSCNAPCPRFIMIPLFNGKDNWAVFFTASWSSSASDIGRTPMFEVGEQLRQLVMIWHIILSAKMIDQKRFSYIRRRDHGQGW